MRTHTRQPAPPPGFTLVELLVTVSVIALLVGLIAPALAAARARSQAAKCLVQEQQLVLGINTFATDTKGRLPANRTRTTPTQYVTWRSQFVTAGYMPSPTAFVCAAQPSTAVSEMGVDDNGATCIGDIAASYALNGHIVLRLNAPQTAGDQTEAAILRPAHTAVLVESRAQFPDMRVISELLTSYDSHGGHYGFWHDLRGTYGFIDGHVEELKLMETGGPDCRWHNGKDLTQDPDEPQDPREFSQHDHPDWKYLVAPVYLR